MIHQIQVKIKENKIDGISWKRELRPLFLSKKIIGIVKSINKTSLINDSQGNKLLPRESLIASPKHPQSLTHSILIPSKNPSTQVAVCKVRNEKKTNREKTNNNVMFILALTIRENPKTISKTEIKTAKKRAKKRERNRKGKEEWKNERERARRERETERERAKEYKRER